MISLPLLSKFLWFLQIFSLLFNEPISQQSLWLLLILLILIRPQDACSMEISEFLEQSLVYNFLFCRVELVELLNKVLLIGLVKLLLWNLDLFQRRQSFIHAIRLAECIRVCFLKLLHYEKCTVLSSYSIFLATPSCLLMIFMAIFES